MLQDNHTQHNDDLLETQESESTSPVAAQDVQRAKKADQAEADRELIIPELVASEKPLQKQAKASHTKKNKIIDVEVDDDSDDAELAGLNDDDDTSLDDLKVGSLIPIKKKKKGIKKSHGKDVAQKDILQQYFREVGRYPILTREQEHELAVQFVESQDRSIAYRLITSNLRLVVKIAKEYQSNIANLMDLIQEGNVGLIKGVAKYDPTKGVRLGSYAQWWIRAYMLKYLVNNARLVKVGTTQAQRKLFFSLNKEKNRLKAAGFKPEPGIVAKNLGVNVKDVKEMEKRLSRPDLSMDLPLGDDQKSSVGDLMVSNDKSAEDRLIQSDLNQQFKFHLDKFSKTLKDREQILWDKRLMADERLTLREIGDMFGLTRERARQIEKSMLTRLREYLVQELPELGELDIVPAIQQQNTLS